MGHPGARLPSLRSSSTAAPAGEPRPAARGRLWHQGYPFLSYYFTARTATKGGRNGLALAWCHQGKGSFAPEPSYNEGSSGGSAGQNKAVAGPQGLLCRIPSRPYHWHSTHSPGQPRAASPAYLNRKPRYGHAMVASTDSAAAMPGDGAA